MCVGTEMGQSGHKGQSGHAHLPGGSWSPSPRRRLGDGPVHSRGSWEGSALTKHGEGSSGKWKRASLLMLVLGPTGLRTAQRDQRPPWGAASLGAERLSVLQVPLL